MIEVNANAEQSLKIRRYEKLKLYKQLLAERDNLSPFTGGGVVRYHSDVSPVHIEDIHGELRAQILKDIQAIRNGGESRVIILSGDPGMGKTHLINTFRPPEEAEQRGYVLVCNANHWQAEEFEECLLDWILDALMRPRSESTESSELSTNLLLEKIRFLAFALLDQILADPRLIRQYLTVHSKWFIPALGRLFSRGDRAIRQLAADRNDAVFRMLKFPKFAETFGNRFLAESRNPFHRYVVSVLLRYLFPEDRTSVIGWLRRKTIPESFYKSLGWREEIDRHFKYMEMVKILISLFTPEVSAAFDKATEKSLNNDSRVFFFAFDQIEGRDELFRKKEDWITFFAQLSELYNSLPNVFILFTMTDYKRRELYPSMEQQFKHRITSDRKYALSRLKPEEVLALYEGRLKRWLASQTDSLAEDGSDELAYLPFENKEHLLKQSDHQSNTVRKVLCCLDEGFRHELGKVIIGPQYDFLCERNEQAKLEEEQKDIKYFDSHPSLVATLLQQCADTIQREWDLTVDNEEIEPLGNNLEVTQLIFHKTDREGPWVRAWLVRLPWFYRQAKDSVFSILRGKQTKRNLMWLIRVGEIEWANPKPDQIEFVPYAEKSTQTTLLALSKLLTEKSAGYADKPEHHDELHRTIVSNLRRTYLGSMLDKIRDRFTEPGVSPELEQELPSEEVSHGD